MSEIQSSGNGRVVSLIVLFALGLIIVIFTIQNTIIVPIKLLTTEVDLSLALVIFTSLFIGVLIAIFAFFPVHWRITRDRNRLLKKLNKVETELDRLKKTTAVRIDTEGEKKMGNQGSEQGA